MNDRVLTVGGWLGTVLVALAIGRFAAIDPRWDGYVVWAAAAGIACVLIYAAVNWRHRTTPLASAVAIAVALNVVADRYGARWDLTSNHMYEPSPETRAALRTLDAPLRILLPARQADVTALRDRLNEYAEASPQIVIQVGPTSATEDDGAAIVEYKGRIARIKAESEQDFTNAVIRLREGRTRTIYFTTGHAERDAASTERAGYSGVAAALERENFVVDRINIARDGSVPADATLVIAAGPRVDFFRAEIESLGRYFENGGAILFLVDPFEDLKRYITESGNALFMLDPSSAFSSGELRNLSAFVRAHGADLGNDVVVDASERGQFLGTDASVPVATAYPPHPITRGLTSLSAYPMARSVRPVAVDGRTVSAIIETGDRTWSERDIQQLAGGRPSLDQARGDRPGPVPLGVAISAPRVANSLASREPRLVVVGDSDFVANYSANVPGNAGMFLSIVDWLAQEHVLTIPPRVAEPRTLDMTASQQRYVSWFALLFLPALAFGAAVYLRKLPAGP